MVKNLHESMSQVDTSENNPENDPEKLSCVVSECDARIGPQGYQGHLRFQHDYSPEEAKSAFDEITQKDSKDRPDPQGGEPDPEPIEESAGTESFHVENDPEVQRLEMERERLKRLVEVERYESMLSGQDDDSDSLDDLERLLKLKELLDDDDSDGETEAIKEELRALRGALQGQQQSSPNVSTDDPLALLVASNGGGDLDPESLALVAEMRQKSFGEAFLEGLEKIDWSSVGDALGGLIGGPSPAEIEKGQQQRQAEHSAAEKFVNEVEENEQSRHNDPRDDVQGPGDGETETESDDSSGPTDGGGGADSDDGGNGE